MATEDGAAAVSALIDEAASRLSELGVESARLDAQILLAYVLGVTRTELFAHPSRIVGGSERSQFDGLLARRALREPLPYLLGEWEFLGLRLKVSSDVLIPRPETEVLVETLAARIAVHPPSRAGAAGLRILDVGSGSGCVALGLAALLPEAEIVGLDNSAAAVDVSRENARRLGLDRRVRFIHGSFPSAAKSLLPLSAVVSNPPYIPSSRLAGLPPEVRDYEPAAAVDGGADGFSLLRPLALESSSLLLPGGWLAVEVEGTPPGAGDAVWQAERFAGLLGEAGSWEAIETVPDLSGTPRVVLARRRNSEC